jgi:arginyl-tRNA synthetase
VKYALLATDPQKPVVFTWDKVLDFERNSAPYIQYTYARAGSILKRNQADIKIMDYSIPLENLERDLVLIISRFPEVFIEAAENLKPSLLADYSNQLADKFNTFYSAIPVLKAHTIKQRNIRLKIVEGVKTVLYNALDLIGIEAPERM